MLIDLGRMEYGAALELQRSLAKRRAGGAIPDTLLLVEHDSVITLGRKTTPANFRAQSIPVFEVERGGDATYHGPGQLVGYPIVLLRDHDVRRHVVNIEQALIKATHYFGIEAQTVEGHPGVWAGGKKIASIGVAVTNWVTYHGFALNINTKMSYFELIRPCGLDPGSMTSMEQISGSLLPFNEVKSRVASEYSALTGISLSARALATSAVSSFSGQILGEENK